MRTPAYLCLLLTCMLISCTPTQEKHEIDYTSYVNPFIGTDFTGNTYPGAKLLLAWYNLVRITDFPDGIVSPVISIRIVQLPLQPHTSLRHRSRRFV